MGGSSARVGWVVVNEAGASVYSASILAGKELPGIDVTLRGAVSIARRLQVLHFKGLFNAALFLRS